MSDDLILFETNPAKYRHWNLMVAGEVATLALDVREDSGLKSGYQLKLNSYDLGVDIELADAVDRLRFEHPSVGAVILTSAKDRVFSAGANIYMLASSGHPFKVNFCKFTNETRLSIEAASRESGQRYLAALNGIASGGGYELALAADEILLVDDGNASVALPEAPLLGVLPGTGGLTRLVDKRMVRRDRADVFSTLVEGIKGKRAVEWKLVDAVAPRSRFSEVVNGRAQALAAAGSRRRGQGGGLPLEHLGATYSNTSLSYPHVRVSIDSERRQADILIRGPEGEQPDTPEGISRVGCSYWPLAVARELDDAILHLRFNHGTVGLLIFRTEGRPEAVLEVDRFLDKNSDNWLVREILLKLRRTFKRIDQTARSLFAIVDPGSCFAGTLLELLLAADRSYMLADPARPTRIGLGPLNDRWFPMANGLSRLETRFLGEPDALARVRARRELIGPEEALDIGLVTFAPDDLDWDDEIRLACEERRGFSPDAMTAMEASLRFAGPETMETKIFGRLTAWQNWIFQRPNAVGETGALTLYGKQRLPEFDWRRT